MRHVASSSYSSLLRKTSSLSPSFSLSLSSFFSSVAAFFKHCVQVSISFCTFSAALGPHGFCFLSRVLRALHSLQRPLSTFLYVSRAPKCPRSFVHRFARGLLPREFRGVILLSAFPPITFLCHGPFSKLQLSFQHRTVFLFLWREHEDNRDTLCMVPELKKRAAASDVTDHSLLFSSHHNLPEERQKLSLIPHPFISLLTPTSCVSRVELLPPMPTYTTSVCVLHQMIQ